MSTTNKSNGGGFLARLVKLGATMGELGVAQAAQKEAMRGARRRAKQNPSGCTPCAAKARGAELANKVWK